MTYRITIVVDNVAEGDVTELAQRIWELVELGVEALGLRVQMSVSKDGFPIDWEPLS